MQPRAKCTLLLLSLIHILRLGLFFATSMLLVTLWAEAFLMFHIATMMIHLLLLVSVLFLAGHLVRDTSLS